MPFVKLDTGILESTLWIDPVARDVFITALLMAEPFELTIPAEQIEVRTLENTGFTVPPGWYGLVHAAGVGIVRRALMDQEKGLEALELLGSADPQSRTSEFGGRRLVRINGGFLVLNFFKYRDKDYTAAERMARLRARRKQQKEQTVTPNMFDVTRNCDVAESREQRADAYKDINLSFDELWKIWPRHESKQKCKLKFLSLSKQDPEHLIISRAHKQVELWQKEGQETQFVPMLYTWLNQRRYDTEPEFIGRGNGNGKAKGAFGRIFDTDETTHR